MSRNPRPPAERLSTKALEQMLSRDVTVAIEEPFVVFSEWASEADEKAYGDWSVCNLLRR
jgi:predicted RecB family nuclease